MKRWCLLGLLIVSLGARAAPVLLNESFDNLATSGWTIVPVIAPPGPTTWFQGNPGIFSAHAGAPNAYAAANFNSPAPGGVISTWLISPEIQFASQLLTFFTRTEAVAGALFGDGLRVLLSLNGASLALSDFNSILGINVANAPGGYPDDWTMFATALAAGGTGRIAFQYTVQDSLLANYIGLDTVAVTVRSVPEPGTLVLLAIGLAVAWLAWRRTRGAQTIALAVAVAAIASTAGAQGSVDPTAGSNGAMTFPNVRVIHAPSSAASTAIPAGAGLRAYLDPDTGLLSDPSHEDVAALDARLPPEFSKPPTKALSMFRMAGGAVGIKLDERFMLFSVARKSDNGRLVSGCVPGEALAESLVRQSAELPVAQREGQQ